MAKNKKRKPSKRGMKAKNESLHCSSKIISQEKKIKRWAKLVDAIYALCKSLLKLWSLLKPTLSICKSLLEWLWSAL